MLKVYLVRHGEAEGNSLNLCRGVTEDGLNEKGVVQAGNTRDFLLGHRFSKIFSSPTLRARQTAEIIVDYGEIVYLSCLREFNFGDAENISWDTMGEVFENEYNKFVHTPHLCSFPNGDIMGEKFRSIKDFVSSMLMLDSCNNLVEILVVSHGVTIKLLTLALTNKKLEQFKEIGWSNNCAITVIETGRKEGSEPKILLENYCDHLSVNSDIMWTNKYKRDTLGSIGS